MCEHRNACCDDIVRRTVRPLFCSPRLGRYAGCNKEGERGNRCENLRTLVLALGHMEDPEGGNANVTAEAVALALAASALPRLRALQLVLVPDEGEQPGSLLALWAALAQLPELASLTLGWALHGVVPLTLVDTYVHIADRLAEVHPGALAPYTLPHLQQRLER
jgi:hypothetical protein